MKFLGCKVSSAIFALLASVFATTAIAAENTVVYGEQLYTRSSGQPVTEVNAFSINTPQGEYTLKIRNGEGGTAPFNPVTSAIIKVNGELVASPNDFSRQTQYIERTFPLSGENSIEVTLRGKPGSALRISIEGFENFAPDITSEPITNIQDNIDYRYEVLANDPDDDPLTYQLTQAPAGMAIDSDTGVITWAPVEIGTFEVAVVADDGQGGTDSQNYQLTVTDGTPPIVTAPADITTEATALETPVALGEGNAEDDHDGALSANPNQTGPFTLGQHTLVWSATDAAGNTGTDTQLVTVQDTTPPLLTLPSDIIYISDEPVTVDLGEASATDIFEPIAISNDAPSLFDIGETVVTWTATDANGNSSNAEQWVVVESRGGSQDLPPDPSDVAPPLDNPNTSLLDATAFLYTGANPIQTGVAEGTIEERRAAVIRGRALDRDNEPLPGVTITIKGHNEFGQTLSRADGEFDLVVNGGNHLVIDYEKDGYLPVQRQVRTPWQEYVIADDIVMIQLDTRVTTVELGGGSLQPIQVAQGSPQTDADGTRQATLLFLQGTEATMKLPNGSTQSLTTLNVRATEYTVGNNGYEAMPGELPPTSAYTYAVELSVDEALAAGAERVDFNQPVPLYVDNFLGFPTGEIVPAGYYDRKDARWKAGDNGRVIEILGIEGGLAVLDITGEGVAASDFDLAELGITEEELQQLASLYYPGHSLWRTPISHFTPWDCNWPYGPPLDAAQPNVPEPETQETDQPENSNEENECPGCVISPQRQTLGESLPLAGTPFELVYRSDRTPGYKNNVAEIILSGNAVSSSLMSIRLDIDIAGKRIVQSFGGEPNQRYRFEWDGLDVYGREVQGSRSANVEIIYQYECLYYSARENFETAWARVGDAGTVIGRRGNCRSVNMSRRHSVLLVPPSKVRPESVGAWSLNLHHAHDPNADMLLLGNGGRRSGGSAIIDTIAGDGTQGYQGDGGPATDARLNFPFGVAIDAEGNIYISDRWDHRVRRVSPNGTISTVVGTGEKGASGDGGPATDAKLNYPAGVAVDAAGNLYIADAHNNRVRKVNTDGVITTVAGSGVRGFYGDGGPATNARLYSPNSVAVDALGNLYIADERNNRIRWVNQDGVIDTLAGTGYPRYSGDGGPAAAATLAGPASVALDAAGNLYFVDSHYYIRRVSPDGIITTIAGSGNWGFSGDGGAATAAKTTIIKGVALDATGNLYFSDIQNRRIRQVNPNGIINTIAGAGGDGLSGDGGSATASLLYAVDVAINAAGDLYFASHQDGRVRRVHLGRLRLKAEANETMIPSEDGTSLYYFDVNGRHVRTSSAVTGIIQYTFDYDVNGLLSDVTDGDGNITFFERDSVGNATAIVAPDGQRTELITDSNGHLIGLGNTAGQYWLMGYTNDGLLTRFENPNGHVNTFNYDANGRLISDEAPNGGGWTINRTGLLDGYLTEMSSGEGRLSTFIVRRGPLGHRIYQDQGPDGSVTERIITFDSTKVTSPNGTQVLSEQGPDPRFGMLAPVTTERRVTTPSGLELLQTTERTVSLEDPQDRMSHTALTTTVTINDRTQTAAYDVASHAWTHTSPEGRTLSRYLNEKGVLAKVQVPGLAETRYKYDERGRLTQIDRGYDTQRPIQFGYDGFGYLNSLTDAHGKTVSYINDATGKVLQQLRPDGSVVDYEYDLNGNLIEMRLPRGDIHTFKYTTVDQQERYTPPNPDDSATDAPVGSGHPTTQYQYNLDKQLEAIIRPDGTLIDYIYNGTTGQLTDSVIPEGTYNYSYFGESDAFNSGQLKTITAPGGQQTGYQYDGFLLTGVTWSGVIAGNVGYQYNNNFEPGTQTVGGASLGMNYNKDGQLIAKGDLTIDYVEDNGLLEGTLLSNMSTGRTYNAFGELATYNAQYSGSTLYHYDLNRDEVGRIVGKTEQLGGTTTQYDYVYDQSDRLVQVKEDGMTVQSWDYDANGNRTHEDGSLVAAYDAQDRLTQYKDNEYRYTANGELTEKTNTATNDTTHYSYDAFSNLRNVTLPDGANIEYVIDGQNRRVGKKRNGVLEQGFLYQGQLNPVAELDGNSNVVARFVYGDKINVPSYLIKDGVNYRVISDHLGSVRLVVNASTGEVQQRLDYDAWGNVTQDTNPGFQPFGYAGGIYDRDTGLVRFGARDYDLEIGRWTTKDPIGFRGGLNHYAYVDNDAINYFDPEGLQKYSHTTPESHNGGKPHVHWGSKNHPRQNAVNNDGTVRHGKEPPNKVKKMINKAFGWRLSPFLLLPIPPSILEEILAPGIPEYYSAPVCSNGDPYCIPMASLEPVSQPLESAGQSCTTDEWI